MVASVDSQIDTDALCVITVSAHAPCARSRGGRELLVSSEVQAAKPANGQARASGGTVRVTKSKAQVVAGNGSGQDSHNGIDGSAMIVIFERVCERNETLRAGRRRYSAPCTVSSGTQAGAGIREDFGKLGRVRQAALWRQRLDAIDRTTR